MNSSKFKFIREFCICDAITARHFLTNTFFSFLKTFSKTWFLFSNNYSNSFSPFSLRSTPFSLTASISGMKVVWRVSRPHILHISEPLQNIWMSSLSSSFYHHFSITHSRSNVLPPLATTVKPRYLYFIPLSNSSSSSPTLTGLLLYDMLIFIALLLFTSISSVLFTQIPKHGN